MRKYQHPIYKTYSADKAGNIYNAKNEPVKQHTKDGEYLRLSLCYKGKKFHCTAHKFIWECIKGNPIKLSTEPDGCTIHHKDGNKFNNAFSNLKLMTMREHSQLHCKLRGMHTYDGPSASIAASNSAKDIRHMRAYNNRTYKKHYEAHREEMQDYNKNYMKDYFEDPHNYEAHRIRCFVRDIIRRKYVESVTKESYDYMCSVKHGECISYRIPLYHLVRFGDLPRIIILDVINLVITKKRVTRYSYIDDSSIEAAIKLEAKYPECKGLTDYLMKLRPQFTKKAA